MADSRVIFDAFFELFNHSSRRILNKLGGNFQILQFWLNFRPVCVLHEVSHFELLVLVLFKHTIEHCRKLTIILLILLEHRNFLSSRCVFLEHIFNKVPLLTDILLRVFSDDFDGWEVFLVIIRFDHRF